MTVGTVTRRCGLGLLLAVTAFGTARAALSKRTSFAYGKKSDQKLDVYQQANLSQAPVLVFVHGGAWTVGDRGNVHALPAYAERNGFLLVSVGYRLAPDADAGGQTEDLAAAVAWVKANAATYGGDPGRVYLVGHSAGAHLVSLVSVDPAYLAAQGLAPKDIAGVICLDGAGYNAVQEMALFDRRGGRIAHMFHMAFEKRPEALSPTLVVRPGVPYPPFLILFITSRPDSPPQSRAFGVALRNAGARVSVRPTSDATHGEINESFGKPGDAEGELGAAFIKTGLLPENAPFGGRFRRG